MTALVIYPLPTVCGNLSDEGASGMYPEAMRTGNNMAWMPSKMFKSSISTFQGFQNIKNTRKTQHIGIVHMFC